MRLFRKIIIWLAVIIIALVVITFVASSFLLNSFKPKLEQIITENIGYETRIEGRMALKIMPGLSVIANDLKVISNETYLLSIKKIEVSVDYTQLLNKTIKVDKLYLIEPRAYIIRNESGIFNFEKLYAQVVPNNDNENKSPVDLNLDLFSIQNGQLHYFDLGQKDTLEITGLNLDSEDISVTGKVNDVNIKQLDFKGLLTIDHFKMNNLMMDSLKLLVEGNNGIINLREQRREFIGGKVEGQAEIDFNQKPVAIDLTHQVTDISATEFLRMIDSDEYLGGNISYTLNLNFKSFDWAEAKKTANGSVLITGNNITYFGLDLDKKLEEYKITEQFDIWEVGAIFLAGPYGSAFSSGLNYSSLLQNYQGEQTMVEQLHADWKIKNGIARAHDVALRTAKYRIAATGSLDLTRDSFDNFSLSMLDKNGCTVFSQTLNGQFSDPESSSFAIKGVKMRSVADIQKLLMMPSKRSCSPVYSGTVAHPGS